MQNETNEENSKGDLIIVNDKMKGEVSCNHGVWREARSSRKTNNYNHRNISLQKTVTKYDKSGLIYIILTKWNLKKTIK